MIITERLEHYGVLGMKWGVRHNPTKAFRKANRKMTRLDRRATKKRAKARRIKYSWLASEKKINKRYRKADRAVYKAAKWYQKVSKTLGDEKASTMTNKQQVNMGERYCNWLIYGEQ